MHVFTYTVWNLKNKWIKYNTMGTDSQLQERTSGYWLGEGWGNSKIGEGDKGLCKINKTQITM